MNWASGDEVREKLRSHDCAGGPNECGDCCTCREAQAHYAIDRLDDENKRLRAQRRVLTVLLGLFAACWLALVLATFKG